jgi:hypothetical protein
MLHTGSRRSIGRGPDVVAGRGLSEDGGDGKAQHDQRQNQGDPTATGSSMDSVFHLARTFQAVLWSEWGNHVLPT